MAGTWLKETHQAIKDWIRWENLGSITGIPSGSNTLTAVGAGFLSGFAGRKLAVSAATVASNIKTYKIITVTPGDVVTVSPNWSSVSGTVTFYVETNVAYYSRLMVMHEHGERHGENPTAADAPLIYFGPHDSDHPIKQATNAQVQIDFNMRARLITPGWDTGNALEYFGVFFDRIIRGRTNASGLKPRQFGIDVADIIYQGAWPEVVEMAQPKSTSEQAIAQNLYMQTIVDTRFMLYRTPQADA